MFDKSILMNERHNYNFLPEFLLMVILTSLIGAVYLSIPVEIWGFKDVAVFDVWTFEHVASGMVISSFAISQRKWFFHPIALTLLISFGWEMVEHYIETQSYPLLMDWFAGTEHWANRIVADQLAVLIGFTLVKAFPEKLFWARMFSFVFVLGHIVLGTSMYFH